MSKYGKKNVGEEDRKVRYGVAGALALAGLAVKGKGAKAGLLGAAAGIGATAYVGSCPLYSFLGVNSAA
ncbi:MULTISPECIES: YgaP-like transmembrane domain [Corynebacterium]|uniref:YgaP-like transmembrane domain n=1 Tax=Corynebacterium TaxID=1716 RepID=UPI00124E5E41|nr:MULTISPECIES: YgaP-like transmembrane domain [Corynebacterium]MBV7282251.1 DUF2892 domain-containing protein [Corynebacterium sp. TAE3-ERU30]MBV7302408.1 DUF2892 domain-containing protein [Corynebacterium sp. TAE3-ERU2]